MVSIMVTIYLFALGMTTLIAFLTGLYVFFYREKNRTNVLLILLFFVLGYWTLCTLFKVHAVNFLRDINAALFLHTIGQFGIDTIPYLFFIFTFAFTGEEEIFQKKYLILSVFIIPLIFLFMLITNEFHHLYYYNVYLEFVDSYGVMITEKGPIYFLNAIGAYFITSFAFYNYFRLYFRFREGKNEFFLTQVALNAFAFLFAIATIILQELTFLGLISYFDFRPVAVLIGFLVVLQALFKIEASTAIPPARDYIIHNLDYGYIVINRDMWITDLNEQAKKYLLSHSKNYLGKNLITALQNSNYLNLSEHHVRLLENQFREVFDDTASNRVFELTVEIGEREGEQLSLEIALSHVRAKNTDYVILILKDISEQKKLELIKESEQKFRALVEQSLDGIALLNVDGTIRFCNNAFARLFGYYTINEIEKLNFLKFIPVETLESERDWLKEDLNLKSEPGVRLIKAMKKNGIIFDLEYSFRIIDDPVTRTALIHIIARDVSARIDFESRRARFTEITSHELRTPLAIISGYVELLNDQLDELDDTSKEEYFTILQQNIERLANLIDDVRTLGKIERHVFQLVKAEVKIYDFLVENILPKKKLLPGQLDFHIHPEGATDTLIEADTSRLTQVLDNLLDNAIKHTPIDNKKIVVSLDITSNGVKIEVTDNGAGINAQDLERIFDPFMSIPSKYYTEGTGIGLFISRSIVEAHGGTLTAYSEGKDKGATFTLTLPRKKSF